MIWNSILIDKKGSNDNNLATMPTVGESVVFLQHLTRDAEAVPDEEIKQALQPLRQPAVNSSMTTANP